MLKPFLIDGVSHLGYAVFPRHIFVIPSAVLKDLIVTTRNSREIRSQYYPTL